MLVIPTTAKLLECAICGRRILVEQNMVGASHNSVTFATCWSCLSDEAKQGCTKRYGVKE